MTDDLRTRIAAVQSAHDQLAWGCKCGWEYDPIIDDSHFDHVADAVIRELDGKFLDFALWLSEELRGEPISRIDAESCLKEWKWLNDHSRWLRSDDD